ncbi:MAG: indole-3-glycerol phosphate synthase TrpC [Betaproteobacteria bacterium]|nr:indole-3-glycerol phosphate synthase TrpC [Betaproteobacteria bacterium]
MADILQEILATKYREVADARRQFPLEMMRERAISAPPPRDFVGAIRAKHAANKVAVIAEIKKASPSAGAFRAKFGGDFDPGAFAKRYETHGAACLSVLTDREYFQGSTADLVAARTSCNLPVLRKDFIIDPYQIFEARAMGADAVLFIMGAVDISVFQEWEKLAASLGLAVLAESHNEVELQQALSLETPLIGINNRDLTKFTTEVNTTLRLKEQVPANRLLVTESGIDSADIAGRLTERGIRTFLVGGALMSLEDPGAGLQALFPFGLL